MGKQVLIVDDSKTMRELISFTLSKAGFELCEAEDGVKALEVADGKTFDLIITDLNMPNMNGIELIKKLRSLPNFKTVPILMLTTESDEFKKFEGKNAGATGWIVKPFNPERLLQVIGKVCI
jgi:two-component system chemotaxis response regulator CheY